MSDTPHVGFGREPILATFGALQVGVKAYLATCHPQSMQIEV